MTEAVKFDKGKAGLDLLPVQAKKAIAEVFDFGAKKYARHNWRSGFNYSRLIAAAERHLDAFNDGEDLDPESGKSHLAHLGCCVMMLLESVIKGYGVDDRYKEADKSKPVEVSLGIWDNQLQNPTEDNNEIMRQIDGLHKAGTIIAQNTNKYEEPTKDNSWLARKLKAAAAEYEH